MTAQRNRSSSRGDAQSPRDEIGTPYDVLLGDIDMVLAEWRGLVRPTLGSDLPPARLMDSLPEILPRLVRLARNGTSRIDAELCERIAREHGSARREDEVPVPGVAEEWQALSRACAQVLAARGVGPDVVAAALARLDALIDDALGYTLRGYYREELDSLRGRGLERRQPRPDRRGRGGDRRGDGRA